MVKEFTEARKEMDRKAIELSRYVTREAKSV